MKRQGIAGGRPVVLQLAGGFGVGPVAEIFQSILSVQTPIELIVVAGKNAAAKKKLETTKVDKRHRVKVLGFTDQMDDLMAAADVVVSKPGGLTTSETLARGCAMVVVNPIPGQESRNSDYLLENGAAIKINNLPTLAMKLDALLTEPTRLEKLRLNAKRIGRPQAAFDVAARALRLAGAGRRALTAQPWHGCPARACDARTLEYRKHGQDARVTVERNWQRIHPVFSISAR
jgi:processive 1,2-diacylglycerol beta-glucosyltransferase